MYSSWAKYNKLSHQWNLKKMKMIHLVKFILQNMNNIEESSQNQKGKNSFIFPIEFGNL